MFDVIVFIIILANKLISMLEISNCYNQLLFVRVYGNLFLDMETCSKTFHTSISVKKIVRVYDRQEKLDK
jgi:hypothetical protein